MVDCHVAGIRAHPQLTQTRTESLVTGNQCLVRAPAFGRDKLALSSDGKISVRAHATLRSMNPTQVLSERNRFATLILTVTVHANHKKNQWSRVPDRTALGPDRVQHAQVSCRSPAQFRTSPTATCRSLLRPSQGCFMLCPSSLRPMSEKSRHRPCSIPSDAPTGAWWRRGRQ